MPPLPVVIVDDPVTNILPPVSVPMDSFFAAFRITASELVLAVCMFFSTVKLPVSVSINIFPTDTVPVSVPTVPITKPPDASVKLIAEG